MNDLKPGTTMARIAELERQVAVIERRADDLTTVVAKLARLVGERLADGMEAAVDG